MPAVRRTVGRYEVMNELGRGGMATVYLARQIDLDRLGALKELDALPTPDPSFAQRFLREARLAGSLSHPNIVTVHDYFEQDGAPYIAMEYIERGSLRPYIGALSLPQAGGVLESVLAGLSYAERHEIVHRDLKPENIMITSDGRVKIADFGIARATSKLRTTAALTATGTAVGTPNYMAPEQALAEEVGPWTDLYSVGIMAFEIFVGHPPFADTPQPLMVIMRQVKDPIPLVTEIDPSIDPRIAHWIAWLTSKEPRDRPQSAAEAWDALEGIVLPMLGPRWQRSARLQALAAPIPIEPATQPLDPTRRSATVPGAGAAA